MKTVFDPEEAYKLEYMSRYPEEAFDPKSNWKLPKPKEAVKKAVKKVDNVHLNPHTKGHTTEWPSRYSDADWELPKDFKDKEIITKESPIWSGELKELDKHKDMKYEYKIVQEADKAKKKAEKIIPWKSKYKPSAWK